MGSNHSDRKHAVFSASSSKRWMTCPGSVALSREAPPQAESVYAKEGTDAHECLEFLVKRFSNVLKAAAGAKKRWPDEMVEHCLTCSRIIFDLRPSPSATLFTEQRVYLKSLGKGFFGTLDYAWVEDFGKLVVIDFKYGAGVTVDAEEDGKPNSQLMYYALGLVEKLGDDFESVDLVVIQPRVYAPGEYPVSSLTVPVRAVTAFREELHHAIMAANVSGAPLVAGDHCKFCPAAANCPELSTNTMAKADIVFDVEGGEILAAPQVNGLTAETLPKILAVCDNLEKWIDAVRARAFDLANGGAQIPGYKLVAKRAQRVWDKDAEDAAFQEFGQRAYREPELLSPSQLEKMHGKAGKEFAAKHTSAISSGFNLVPEKHKSPAVKTTSVFDH